MVAVWGRATVIVDADGRGLVAQTKALTEKAGDEAATGFNKKFSDGLNKKLKPTLDRFSKSFKTWSDNIGGSDTVLGRLHNRTKAFLKTVGNTEPMIKARLRMGEWGDSLRTATSRIKNFLPSMDELDTHLGNQQNLWHRLSANTRQWTLIIGAVIASMTELAGLASAAGAGLFVLAGGLSAVIIAGGVGFAAFKEFLGNIDKVPASVLPARKAFDGLKATLGDIQTSLTEHTFAGTETAFNSLNKTVKALGPALDKVADVLNGLIKDFAKFFKVGSPGFDDLNGLIEKSAGWFDKIARSAGKFGDAILHIFNNPTFKRATDGFLDWIDTLATRFDNFAHSNGLDVWMQHAIDVFGHLGPLLDTAGRLLNNLVTDESIKQLTDFIDNINGFLSGGGAGLLDFAQKLNIFGLLSEALDEFGKALEPLSKPMSDLADALSDVISAGIASLVPLITDLSKALAPLVETLADFMKNNPDAVAAGFTAVLAAFAVLKGGELVAKLGGFLTFLKGFNKNTDGKATSKLKNYAGAVAGLGVAFSGLQSPAPGGTDILSTLLGGTLTGASLGGGIGALVGSVAALVASMIQDVFLTPEVKGSWQKGWDQLFDPNNYSGAGIGPLKKWFQNNLMGPDPSIPESGGGWLDQTVTNWSNTLTNWRDTDLPNFWDGLGTAFQNGWTQISTFFQTNFGDPLENGWNQIVTFFSVSVPGFFQSIGTFFANGWTLITNWFNTNFVNPVKNSWTIFWNFLTVTLPGYFSTLYSGFLTWLAKFTAPFTNFFNTVKTNWNNFWAGLGAIVTNTWNGLVNAVRGPVNTIIGIINTMIDKINAALGAIRSITGGLVNLHIPNVPGFASGGVLTGPTRILAGEAGPEAIVPLNRPLSQVDPSVRGLSAVAQGKAASGGVVGTGSSRTINVSEGAIQVITRDERRAAIEVVNRLVEVAS
jgi:hypothetical protein